MDKLTPRVLGMFQQLGKDVLDLHELFEAGGNDPRSREQVLEIVEGLVRDGLLAEQGNDFYSLTESGKVAVKRASDSTSQD